MKILKIIMFATVISFANNPLPILDSTKLYLDTKLNMATFRNQIPTKYLMEKGFSWLYENERFRDSIQYAGVVTKNKSRFASTQDWFLLYEAMRLSYINNGDSLPFTGATLNIFCQNLQNQNANVVPLGLIFRKANMVSDTASIKLMKTQTANGGILQTLPKLTSTTIQALAPLVQSTKTKQIMFRMYAETSLHNINFSNSVFQVASSDNYAWQTLSNPYEALSYNFVSEGKKALYFRVIQGTDTLRFSSSILVEKPENIVQPDSTFNIEISKNSSARTEGEITDPNDPYNRAEVSIYKGCDGVLNKPLYVIEGFDPNNDNSNTNNLNSYSGLFQGSFYDLVLINFKNGGSLTKDKTELVKEMIKRINANKRGKEESILLGESQGGLCGRLALRELENENYDHQVGVFLSYDSPHQGANVPLGLQHLSYQLAEYPNALVRLALSFSGNLDVLQNTVAAPATKELPLKYHLSPNGHPYRIELINKLNQTGYPQKCTNAAITLGDNSGNGQIWPQGSQIFLGNKRSLLLDIDLEVNTENGTPNQRLGQFRFNPWLGEDYNKTLNWQNSEDTPIDVSPGGVRSEHSDASKNLGFILQVNTTFGRNNYSFLPTASALDLSTDYPGFNRNTHWSSFRRENAESFVETRRTPFDDVFSIDRNSIHVIGLDRSSFALPSNSNSGLNHYITDAELDLQNRQITRDRTFKVSDKIRLGNNLDRRPIARNGDVVISNGAKVEMQASNSIEFFDGVDIQEGTSFETILTSSSNNCANVVPERPIPIINGPTEIVMRKEFDYVYLPSTKEYKRVEKLYFLNVIHDYKVFNLEEFSNQQFIWEMTGLTEAHRYIKKTITSTSFLFDESLFNEPGTFTITCTASDGSKSSFITNIIVKNGNNIIHTKMNGTNEWEYINFCSSNDQGTSDTYRWLRNKKITCFQKLNEFCKCPFINTCNSSYWAIDSRKSILSFNKNATLSNLNGKVIFELISNNKIIHTSDVEYNSISNNYSYLPTLKLVTTPGIYILNTHIHSNSDYAFDSFTFNVTNPNYAAILTTNCNLNARIENSEETDQSLITEKILTFSLIPNPSQGTFKIIIPTEIKQLKVKISKITGENILEKEMQNSAEGNEISVLQAGVYMVSCQTEGKIWHQKVVIY